jgi:hypothetical protein
MSNARVSCKANNKQGRPCRAAATASGYCHFHANPGKAAELGRSGGKKNRHVVDDEARPLPPLNSTSNLKDAVGILIGDMHAKRFSSKTAAGIAPLLNTMFRILNAKEMEDRLLRLEAQMEEMCSRGAEKSSTGTVGRSFAEPHIAPAPLDGTRPSGVSPS